jgi:hypothetical protein
MFQFSRSRFCILCIQMQMMRYYSHRVPPFGHLRFITPTGSPKLFAGSTSFFAFWCQGIPQQPFLTWPKKNFCQFLWATISFAFSSAFFIKKRSCSYTPLGQVDRFSSLIFCRTFCGGNWCLHTCMSPISYTKSATKSEQIKAATLTLGCIQSIKIVYHRYFSNSTHHAITLYWYYDFQITLTVQIE